MKGLGCAFVGIVIVSLSITAGLYIVVDGLSGYGQAREQTKQVQIVADASVDIAQINADAAVEIAGINADATKKTSMAFVTFYALRAILWGAGLVWAVIIGGFIWRKVGDYVG